MKRICALLLILLLTGCAAPQDIPADPADTTADGVTAAPPAVIASQNESAAIAQFALDLLRQENPGEQNTLLSPLSLIAALGMAANGAAGNTLVQMEEVLGLPIDHLNTRMPTLLAESDQLGLANGIWYRDRGMTVLPEFLAVCDGVYGATAKAAAMDPAAREEINAFIRENTLGMITDMLGEDDLPPETAAVLVNALAFEAEWASKFSRADNVEDDFLGYEAPVTYMDKVEKLYLQGEGAVGFIKPYAGGQFAFAAILPNEGILLEDYLAELDGATLTGMLSGAEDATVLARLPKFSYTYDVDLAEALTALGMTDAFDGERADFSRLGRSNAGNIFIQKALHRTLIEVGEEGTRAAAATSIVMIPEWIWTPPEDAKTVHLTRPFLYLIIDLDHHIPLFMGTMVDPS